MLRRNADAVAIVAIVVVYGIVQFAGYVANQATRFKIHAIEAHAEALERKAELLGTRFEAAGERFSQRVEERARRMEEKAKLFEERLQRRFQ